MTLQISITNTIGQPTSEKINSDACFRYISILREQNLNQRTEFILEKKGATVYS